MKINSNSNYLGGRVALSFFFAIFFLIGTVTLIVISKDVYQDLRSYFWASGECVITKSDFNVDLAKDLPFELKINYQLNWTVGQAVILGEYKKSFDSFKKAKILERNFTQGSVVKCYFHPEQPSLNVLVRRSPLYGLILLLPMVFMGIGLLGLIASLINWKARPVSRVGRKPFSFSKKWKIFIVLILAIGAYTSGYYLVFQPYQKLIVSNSWQEYPAQVVKSWVKTIEGDDSNTYKPIIFYRYQVNGEEYYSNELDFFSYSSSNYQWAAKISERYYSGKEIQIYLDPKDPLNVVIERRVTSLQYVFAIIPLILVLLIFGLLINRKSSLSKNPYSSASPDISWLPASKFTLQLSPNGQYLLSPEFPRKGKFIGLLVMSVIFDTIIYFMWGNAPTLMTIIFGIFGVLITAGMLMAFLQIFNPKITLGIDSAKLKMGIPYQLFWKLEKKSKVVEGFQIKLQLEEQATFRRGTDTKTEKRVVYEETLISYEGKFREKEGARYFTIPAHLMHSFYSANNKLVYYIICIVKVRRYPDLNEKFEIVVESR